MPRQPDIQTSMPVYEAIRMFIIENGYSPSLREISARTELAQSNVLYHVRKLRNAGYIEYKDKISRSIRIVIGVEDV